MVLDDNRTFLNMIAMVLKEAAPNHRVLRAHTLAAASEISRSPDISIFIIDVHLPDGTGLDFLGRVRATHPHARAIVMTSSPEADHRDMAHQFGAVRFLAKPIHLKRFADLIRSLLSDENGGAAGLEKLAAVDAIDMQCLALTEARIDMHGGSGKAGWVDLRAGNVLAAQVGTMTGIRALQKIAQWTDVRFELKPLGLEKTAEINRPWRELRDVVMDRSTGEDAKTTGPGLA
jgi:DNA-binding NarL/FixJ family response regulator